MSYKNRFRRLEKKLRLIRIDDLCPEPDDSLKKSGCDNLKLSDVKDNLLSHYSSNVTPNTYRSYKLSFENFIRLIGDKEINSVTKQDIEDFKIKRSKEVNLVSTNIDVRNLKAMFNKMAEFDMIEYSKLSGVKQFKIENKKVLAIETADIVKILNAAMSDQMKQIIRFTLLTASRISEVLSLKIKDIDFTNGDINIYQQKSNSYKTIPLTEKLLELVVEIIHPAVPEDNLTLKESYLFFNKVKNDPCKKLRTETVSKNFKKILRYLGLNENFKFHSLRHTAISELMNNNIPVNIVKEIAGHKSISTTMLYSHVRSEDIRLAVNSLSY